MSRRPRILDLFCGAGGAAMGYARAGFEVVGVDVVAQPRYPFEFVQADALWFVEYHQWATFDAIHASPPCQRYSLCQRIQDRDHPDLITDVRELLRGSGLPYVIENVPDAPLLEPVELCGAMFGLRTYRHRLFEASFTVTAPAHPAHLAETVKMGRPLREGDWYHAVGNFSNVPYVKRDMGVGWMNRDGIRECVPPAYTEHIGRQLMAHLETTSGPPSRPVSCPAYPSRARAHHPAPQRIEGT